MKKKIITLCVLLSCTLMSGCRGNAVRRAGEGVEQATNAAGETGANIVKGATKIATGLIRTATDIASSPFEEDDDERDIEE